MCYILLPSAAARKRTTTNMYGDAILHLAADSRRSIQEIARALFLSASTVEVCLREIAAHAEQVRAAIALLETEAGK